jgi:hypothetical protein
MFLLREEWIWALVMEWIEDGLTLAVMAKVTKIGIALPAFL